MTPAVAAPRIVVLKGDRLYGDLISRQIRELWRHASVQVFQRGFDALDAIQAAPPDLFITGVKLEDMDGLEHLEPFIEHPLPILVVTSRRDARTFSLLRDVRYDGIFDAAAEGLGNLSLALKQVMKREAYISPGLAPRLQPRRKLSLDELTEREQMVLSVIGDGSDDYEAAKRLGLSRFTVNSYRKSIMAKLSMHHKGHLMFYALQQGYVQITPNGAYYPGFQRRIRGQGGAIRSSEATGRESAEVNSP